MSTTISSKGRVTIPTHIRDALGLEKGRKVDFILPGGYARLQPASHSVAAETSGASSAYGRCQ
jgi:AbrB family looped-hinge helix DNA binding protein